MTLGSVGPYGLLRGFDLESWVLAGFGVLFGALALKVLNDVSVTE